MNFEKFILTDYIQTDEGKRVFSFFDNLENIFFNHQEKFLNFVDGLLNFPLAQSYFSFYDCKTSERFSHTDYNSIQEFINEYKLNDFDFDDIRYYKTDIPYNSIFIYFTYPEFTFPYLFLEHFYKFEEICHIFDIPLPKIPGKNKHGERGNYYFELCRSLYEFRHLYQLSPTELCVFLYGFAPRFLTNFVEEKLPNANNIYISGASPEDVKLCLSKNLSANTIRHWQGNENTLPGDIIIIYETAPYSRIGTIWRAVSPGFDDPFSYYSERIFVSHPIKVPYVSFNDLENDSVWGKKGLVKAHMQGLNGRLVNREEYESLKTLFKKSNPQFDTKKIPEPPQYSNFFRDDLKIEKDVEEKLLEPLLNQLGYNVKKEFKRQFPIRMGRGECYFPDYALHLTGTRNEEIADFIWEAKYRILGKKQLAEDFGQAKSYAMRLAAKGLGLVSLEGIWISWETDYFTFDKLAHISWSEMENPDIFGKLKALFNKRCPPQHK